MPTERLFRIEALDSKLHNRGSFSCGRAELDRYFREHASQDMKRRVANCFVCVERSSGRVAAYYTISSASVPVTDLPESITRKLPRYPSIPAVLIGRLAVDDGFQRRGLGGALIADVVEKVLRASAAVHMLLVDALDDEAAKFYRHHGFIPVAGERLRLFLPVETARRLGG